MTKSTSRFYKNETGDIKQRNSSQALFRSSVIYIYGFISQPRVEFCSCEEFWLFY